MAMLALLLLLSYLGFAVGIALSKIAEEEIRPGEKIFQILQQGLFVAAMVVAMILLYQQQRYVFAGLPIALGSVHYLLKIKKYPSLLLLDYVFFTLLYVMIFSAALPSWARLLPIIVFLYGFPSGSLWMANTHHR